MIYLYIALVVALLLGLFYTPLRFFGLNKLANRVAINKHYKLAREINEVRERIELKTGKTLIRKPYKKKKRRNRVRPIKVIN